jgi:hypothetical protein
MSPERVAVFVRVLPLIAALVSTMAAAQQPGPWPDDIESLFFEHLSQIPGMSSVSIEVNCDEHTCLAVLTPTSGTLPELGHEELSPIVLEKRWNAISVGTGGSFDPATGASKGFVEITNDGRSRHPGFPRPPQDPPPRFIPLSWPA